MARMLPHHSIHNFGTESSIIDASLGNVGTVSLLSECVTCDDDEVDIGGSNFVERPSFKAVSKLSSIEEIDSSEVIL